MFLDSESDIYARYLLSVCKRKVCHFIINIIHCEHKNWDINIDGNKIDFLLFVIEMYSWLARVLFHLKENFCVPATEKLAKTFTTTLQELIFSKWNWINGKCWKAKAIKIIINEKLSTKFMRWKYFSQPLAEKKVCEKKLHTSIMWKMFYLERRMVHRHHFTILYWFTAQYLLRLKWKHWFLFLFEFSTPVRALIGFG